MSVTVPMQVGLEAETQVPLAVNSGGEIGLTLGAGFSPEIRTWDIYYDSTEGWAEHSEFVPEDGAIVIYADYAMDEDQPIPGIKIGDGTTHVADLPFVADDIRQTLQEHIDNTQIHVTAAEKDLWNNKASVGVRVISPGEQDYILMFSTSTESEVIE